MPMEAQTRLLRVLARGRIHAGWRAHPDPHRCPDRRGDQQIAGPQIAQGQFREDLYYRLNVVPLRVPPLRERADDVPDLVQHFLASGENAGLPAKAIQPEAMTQLKRYHWPGNVRELENLVNRLAALYAQDEITADIVARNCPARAGQGGGGASARRGGPLAFMDRYLTDYFAQFGEELPPPGLYERIISEVEQPLISAALGGHRRQPDQGGRAAWPKPQHAAQEDSRARYPLGALARLSGLRPSTKNVIRAPASRTG